MKLKRLAIRKLLEASLSILKEQASVFAGQQAFSAIATTFGTSQTSGLMTIWGGRAVLHAEALGSALTSAGSVAEGMPGATAAVAKIQTALGAANTHIATTGGGQAMAGEIAAVLNTGGANGVTFVATSEGTVGFELAAAAEAGTFGATASTVAMASAAVLAIAAVPALALYSLSTFQELEKRIEYIFRTRDGNKIQSNASNKGNDQVSQNGVMAFKPDGKAGASFDLESEPMKQLEAIFPYIFTSRGLKSALRTDAVKPENGTDEGLAVAKKVMALISDRKLDGSNLYRGYMERIVKPGLEKAKIAKKEEEAAIDKELKEIGGGPVEPVKGGEEKQAIKKKKKTGWEGYIEATSDKALAEKVKSGFEELAKSGKVNDGKYGTWLQFYNQMRKDKSTMEAIGAKVGSHLSPKQVIKIYEYVMGRSENIKEVLELNNIIWESRLKRKIIKAQKLINLIH